MEVPKCPMRKKGKKNELNFGRIQFSSSPFTSKCQLVQTSYKLNCACLRYVINIFLTEQEVCMGEMTSIICDNTFLGRLGLLSLLQRSEGNTLAATDFVRLLEAPSLLRSRSGRSHVTLPVPSRLLQTDIHSFLGYKPINVWSSFSCECSRLWMVQRIQWQLNEKLVGPRKQKRKTPRKECMSVWSSRVGTGSVTWLRPERLRRRLRGSGICYNKAIHWDEREYEDTWLQQQSLIQ